MNENILTKKISVPAWFLALSYGWLIFELVKETKGTRKKTRNVARIENELRRQIELSNEQEIQAEEYMRYLKKIGQYDDYNELSDQGAI